MASTRTAARRFLARESRRWTLSDASACSSSIRWFGFGTNWPERARHKKNTAKATAKRNRAKNEASTQSDDHLYIRGSDSKHVPPACLLPTGSQYVYIARSAAIHEDIDPRTIYRSTPSDPLQLKSSLRHFVHHDTPVDPSDPRLFVNEVAFLGRSNVGKSSLINALMHAKLARTAKQPGRTQQAHYFALQDRVAAAASGAAFGSKAREPSPQPRVHGYLVDLPGYGYAVGPDTAVDAWQARTQAVLLARRDAGRLRRVYLLVDARHGGLPLDFSVMRWLDDAAIPYAVVLTKADAASRPLQVKWANQLCMRYEHLVGPFLMTSDDETDGSRADNRCWMHPIVHVTSSSNGLGITELQHSIYQECKRDWTDDQGSTSSHNLLQ